MKLSRGISIALAVVTAALVGGGGQAVWARVEKHVEPHGIDFGIHTFVDTTFCLETEGDGRIILSECAIRDNQHFTFTQNPDGTSVLVDGYGDCLDRGDGKPSTPISAVPCTFGLSERFLYNRKGKLQDPAGTSCIAAAKAEQGSAVFNQRCPSTAYVNVFELLQ